MSTKKILIVGKSEAADAVVERLCGCGWEVHLAANTRAAQCVQAEHRCTVGLLVLPETDKAPCADLDAFLASGRDLEWVGCFDGAAIASPAWRNLILTRLFDHHTLPFDWQRLSTCLGHAHGRASLRLSSGAVVRAAGETMILGRSTRIAALLRQARRVAKAGKPVLIRGETGSDPEGLARAIHQDSVRSRGPFVAVRCSETRTSRLAAALSGPEESAIAVGGLFDGATGGTVFLDGIADLSEDLQTQLSRFLKSVASGRVAAGGAREPDVRVVAASHIDLDRAIADGKFRADLLRALSSCVLQIPPLRERREDIQELAQHFFDRFRVATASKAKGFSGLAVRAMEAHTWPGDVRELMNRVRCALIMAEGEHIAPVDLGLSSPGSPELRNVLDEAEAEAERDAIWSSLQQNGRDVALSARELGISRMSLYRLMVKHGLSLSH